MGKLRQYTEEEVNEIVDLYKNQHVSMVKIAAQFGAGLESIRRVLIENNIHIRDAKDLYGKEVPEDIQKQVIYNYTQLRMGLVSSGKSFGLSQYMVKKILQDNNVYVRSYTESKDNLRKYSCNDDYFKVQSCNMAYVLGMLASDGNVAKTENQINIVLDAEDTEVLEKIRQELQISRPLKTFHRSDEAVNTKMSVFSSTMKRDLAHYSIVPAKTFILQPPELLKEEYYIDYIRGYFDGDGSVYICNNGSCGVSIVGASKPMMEWIRRILAEKYNITCTKLESFKRLYKVNEEHIFYRVTYYGTKIIELYKAFYHCEDLIYMKRKKDKFETILMNKYPRDYESLVKD